MNWHQESAGDIRAAEIALWTALGPHAGSVARRLRADKEFARGIAEKAIADDNALTERFDAIARETWMRCIEAMGPSFVAPFELESVFTAAIRYEPTDIKKLIETCPDDAEMKRLRENGYILLPGPPKKMNLKQVGDLVPIRVGLHHDQDPFTYRDTVKSGWIAITKDPLTGSVGLKWVEQRRLPEHPANVPNAPEIAWSIGMFKAVRHSMLLWCWVNTASTFVSNNRELQVKTVSPDGVHLLFDVDEKVDCGVLACRKFQRP